MTYNFFHSCVGWPRRTVDCEGGLTDMVDAATDISRRTFLKHADRDNLLFLEWSLGYTAHHTHGLTMAGDWSVTYHRSKLLGERVYFFCHSAIEYVFIPPTLNGVLDR